MNKNTLAVIIVFVLFVGAYKFANAPVELSEPIADDSYEYLNVDITKDPKQLRRSFSVPAEIKISNTGFVAKPQAIYRIAAMVVGKKNYGSGWQAKIAPVDLALAWGDLTLPDRKHLVKYSQSGRWYKFKYGAGIPFTKDYIYSHSANTHIIPATENVLKAVNSINVGQSVFLRGYLVNVEGTKAGRSYWWNSSLSREDRGDGACEVFYVDLVKIGEKTYM